MVFSLFNKLRFRIETKGDGFASVERPSSFTQSASSASGFHFDTSLEEGKELFVQFPAAGGVVLEQRPINKRNDEECKAGWRM